MKRLIAFVALAFVGLVTQGQTYFTQTLSGFPTWLAANTSSNLAGSVIIPVRGQKTVSVQIRFRCDDAGTNGVQSFVWASSVDGSTFQSLAAKRDTLSAAADGTNYVQTTTVIDTYGAGYLKLISIGNDDSAALTNLTIKAAIKIAAP